MRLRIREYRKKKGDSQEDLAAALDTTQATISRYETGDQWPSPDVFDSLAEYFGCSVPNLIEHQMEDSQLVELMDCYYAMGSDSRGLLLDLARKFSVGSVQVG